MNINLKALSNEYIELLNREEDPEDELDQDEVSRLAELTELSNTLGGLLEYPAHVDVGVVEDSSVSLRDYALEFYESLELPEDIRAHVDWAAVGSELLSNYCLVEFDGYTFYVLVPY